MDLIGFTVSMMILAVIVLFLEFTDFKFFTTQKRIKVA